MTKKKGPELLPAIGKGGGTGGGKDKSPRGLELSRRGKNHPRESEKGEWERGPKEQTKIGEGVKRGK